MIQCILIFTFTDSKWEESILDHMVASITQIKSPLNFLLNKFFLFVTVVSKYLNCAPFSKRSVCHLYVIIFFLNTSTST
jgi:hypothetical protein